MSLLQKSPPVDDVGLALVGALAEVVAKARPRTRPRLVLALQTLAMGAESFEDLAGLCDRTAVRCGQSPFGPSLCGSAAGLPASWSARRRLSPRGSFAASSRPSGSSGASSGGEGLCRLARAQREGNSK